MNDIELYGTAYLNSPDHDYHQKHDRKILLTRDSFVKTFDLEKLRTLKLEEYALGNYNYKESFCYRIEWELDSLGSIRGSFAGAKFGIYYSLEKKSYVISTKKWGETKEVVFENIRSAIVELISAGARDDLTSIVQNPLSNMFKSKIFYVYYPEKALPIYSKEHLDYFIRALGINCDIDKTTDFEKRSKIIEWKQQSEVFSKMTNLDLMHFLYSSYGFRKQIDVFKEIDSFGTEKDGCTTEMITADYFENREVGKQKSGGKKPNYNDINDKKSAAGSKGEDIVLEYERKSNKKYAKSIVRVSLTDDTLGYDIKSYDTHGNEVHIEVKTKIDGNLERIDFYLTANELNKLQTDPMYMIYYVFGVNSKNRKIIVIKHSQLKNVDFKPELYKINAKAIIKELK